MHDDVPTEIIGKYTFQRIPENYLGQGGFGYVYKGYHSANPAQQVAIKTVESSKLKARELKLISTVKCDYLVKLLRIYSCGELTYVVMELCDGDLGAYLETVQKLDNHNIDIVVDNLARGYQVFQKHKIVHRDIKPHNILLKYDHSGSIRVAKFSDFGTSRLLTCDENQPTNVAGTLQYMAPEVGANLVTTQTYDHPADMWSLGCVLFECITGTVPFDENALCKLFLHVACKNYSSYKKPMLPKSTSPVLVTVTSALLDINAKMRLSPNQLYNIIVARSKRLAHLSRGCLKMSVESETKSATDDMLHEVDEKDKNKWHTIEYFL